MSLHHLLDELAGTAPTVDSLGSADAAWRTASRRRRRTRLTATVTVLGFVLVVALVGTRVDRAPRPALPGQGEIGPGQGIPAQIYSVKPWLPTIDDTPIPPIAYVVEESYLDRPVAISVDGSYRYVPGPPGNEGYELSSYAVSADGRHVSLAWSDSRSETSGQRARAQIWAYDVTTGVRTGPWLGEGFGSEITDLVWRPDNEGFAWQERRPVDQQAGRTTEEIVVVAMYWDHYTQDVEGVEGPVAWSPDGTELLVDAVDDVDGDARVVELPSGASRLVEAPVGTSFGPNAWAPDGSRIAGLQRRTYGVDLVLADPRSGISSIAQLGEDVGEPLLGWRGGEPVLTGVAGQHVTVQVVDSETGVAVGPPVSRAAGARAVERLVAASAVLDTAPAVITEPPSQSRLSWDYLRTRPMELTLLGLLVLGVLGGLTAWTLTRRRNRLPTPPR